MKLTPDEVKLLLPDSLKWFICAPTHSIGPHDRKYFLGCCKASEKVTDVRGEKIKGVYTEQVNRFCTTMLTFDLIAGTGSCDQCKSGMRAILEDIADALLRDQRGVKRDPDWCNSLGSAHANCVPAFLGFQRVDSILGTSLGDEFGQFVAETKSFRNNGKAA